MWKGFALQDCYYRYDLEANQRFLTGCETGDFFTVVECLNSCANTVDINQRYKKTNCFVVQNDDFDIFVYLNFDVLWFLWKACDNRIAIFHCVKIIV